MSICVCGDREGGRRSEGRKGSGRESEIAGRYIGPRKEDIERNSNGKNNLKVVAWAQTE